MNYFIRDCAEKIKSANISIILEPVRKNPQELLLVLILFRL